MDSERTAAVALGAAFVAQFVTSIASAALTTSFVDPDDIGRTMDDIAERSTLFGATIVLDVLTAAGIVFLGAMLYTVLRPTGPRMALVALALYGLEAALLGAAKLGSATVGVLSEERAAGSTDPAIETVTAAVLDATNLVGSTLHVLVFSLGATVFYLLLVRSGLVPRWLALWGLVTVAPMAVWTTLAVLGTEVPFALYIPYVPFELVVGLWLLIAGFGRPHRGTAPTDQPPSTPTAIS